jgi:nitrate/nitrite transport system ATP-binding protein
MAELDAYVSVRGVSKHFFNRKVTNCVLEGIDVDVASGEFLTVIGPSGCGKSTLLNMIAGLVMPDEGTIVVDGKPVTAPGCDRGMVFQQHVLLPWMTAYENVRFGVDCALASRAADERHKLALHYLKVVHLEDAKDKKPSQLSGGMQQRVGIARAFAIQPKVLLLDEPFGSLDALTRVSLQDHLLHAWESERKTVLMVTHDVDEAITLSDRILVMSHGPAARIRQEVVVPFARPRDKERLLRDPDYYELRASLLSVLTREVESDAVLTS